MDDAATLLPDGRFLLSGRLDRTVKIGDEVLISMTWDQFVNVDLIHGIPSLLLETGLLDRQVYEAAPTNVGVPEGDRADAG